MNEEQKAIKLQWHPAFYAALQVELEADANNLTFENEHQLGTKPKEIDVLIVKKEDKQPVAKNIGWIFRKHNIIEYKGPDDSMGIDDFYTAYGYTCFYKADTKAQNSISIDDLTISLVSARYPRDLIKHLLSHDYGLVPIEPGIYRVSGDRIPIQIIVTSQLSEDENLWLRNLTNRIDSTKAAEKLIEEYDKHSADKLYSSMMNIIVTANKKKFQEVQKIMCCEALLDLFKDDINRLADERAIEIANERAIEIANERAIEIANEIIAKVAHEMTVKTKDGMTSEMIHKIAHEVINETAVKPTAKNVPEQAK